MRLHPRARHPQRTRHHHVLDRLAPLAAFKLGHTPAAVTGTETLDIFHHRSGHTSPPGHHTTTARHRAAPTEHHTLTGKVTAWRSWRSSAARDTASSTGLPPRPGRKVTRSRPGRWFESTRDPLSGADRPPDDPSAPFGNAVLAPSGLSPVGYLLAPSGGLAPSDRSRKKGMGSHSIGHNIEPLSAATTPQAWPQQAWAAALNQGKRPPTTPDSNRSARARCTTSVTDRVASNGEGPTPDGASPSCESTS